MIGGGSTYTPELVEGLLRRCDMLPVSELYLVDADETRLSVLGPLTQRMAHHAGSNVAVRYGTDRVAGISGSSFVVSQIRVGGMGARLNDEQLGLEFGLIGQETVGVGGFANALRTIPVALSIAQDIARHAPNAILLNFTNPAGLITEALCRHSDVTTIGLCNVPWSFNMGFAKGLNVSPDAIEMDYVGLNHLSWVRGVTIDGVERGSELVRGMKARALKAQGRGVASDEPAWSPESIGVIDAIPNYYLLYYYETDAWIRYQRGRPARASEVMEIEARLLEQYQDPNLKEKPQELELRGGAYYSETAAALMADIHCDVGSVHIVNVANRGAIPGLADDVVVETAARVTRAGAQALSTEPLRPDMHALVQTVKDFELLTVQAAVEGNQDAAMLALLTNPLGPPAHLVETVWRRLQAVNAGWLGKLEAT